MDILEFKSSDDAETFQVRYSDFVEWATPLFEDNKPFFKMLDQLSALHFLMDEEQAMSIKTTVLNAWLTHNKEMFTRLLSEQNVKDNIDLVIPLLESMGYEVTEFDEDK